MHRRTGLDTPVFELAEQVDRCRGWRTVVSALLDGVAAQKTGGQADPSSVGRWCINLQTTAKLAVVSAETVPRHVIDSF